MAGIAIQCPGNRRRNMVCDERFGFRPSGSLRRVRTVMASIASSGRNRRMIHGRSQKAQAGKGSCMTYIALYSGGRNVRQVGIHLPCPAGGMTAGIRTSTGSSCGSHGMTARSPQEA